MLRAIDFDNTVRFDTGEVDNEATDGNLPAEAQACELTHAQVTPNVPLGARHGGAQSTCALNGSIVSHGSSLSVLL